MRKRESVLAFYCSCGSMVDFDSRTRRTLCLGCGKEVLMGTPEADTIHRVEYFKEDILLLVSQALSQKERDEDE